MNEIEELIKTTDRLCKRLEKASQDDKSFCLAICRQLEMMSWELYRSSNDLKEAVEFYGVNYG
jgi:hypothetical protein